MSNDTELKKAPSTEPKSDKSSFLFAESKDFTADMSSLIFSILIFPFSPRSLRWCSISPL